MLKIFGTVAIPEDEIQVKAVRAQGAGGQNVNKVSSAIQLRFDIRASSLPEAMKERLYRLSDQRITKDGVVIIKAQQYRTQENNLEAARDRLCRLLQRVAVPARKRIATKPTRASQRRRVEDKVRRGRLKAARGGAID